MDDDTLRFLGFVIVPCLIPLVVLIFDACHWCLPNTTSSSSSSSMSDVESLHYDESTIMEEEEEEEAEEEESPHGLDESVINAIPSFIYNTTTMKSEEEEEFDGGDCVICLGEFQDNDHIRTLPLCSHTFHLNCIDVWLRSNPNCPLCRSCLCCFEEDILFKHSNASASEPERMVVIDIPADIVEC